MDETSWTNSINFDLNPTVYHDYEGEKPIRDNGQGPLRYPYLRYHTPTALV